MIKPLTLNVGLAVALGMSSLAFAGGDGKSLPSAQGPCYAPTCAPSAQCPPKEGCFLSFKKCVLSVPVCFPKIDLCCIPKPKINCNYTYTWVLKKQLCGPLITWEKGGHKLGCDACGPTGIYPTGQYASAQGAPATYGSGQVYGAGQAHGEMAPAPPAEGVEAPPAPGGDMPAPPATSMLFLPRGSN
jgi:hypothetical protein